MKRVVVTGLGAVTPLGNTFMDSWSAALSGKSGIDQITRFDVSTLPWKVAGELKGFEPLGYMSAKDARRLDRFAQFAIASARMAVEDAFTNTGVNSSRARHLLVDSPVVIGSSRGGIETIERAAKAIERRDIVLSSQRCRRLSPYVMPASTISMAASSITQHLGIKGACLGISNACASGSSAIGEAYRMIRCGYAGAALAGGTEAPITRLCVEGYGSSGVLSRISDPSASRPFDRNRDGFVLAEGACVFLLEELDKAMRRGARIYGEIIGYGSSADAFHQTHPHADGEASAIIKATSAAGIRPEHVGHISLHGTSTEIGDRIEAEAVGRALGANTIEIPASALKSMTGHMLAASGALEAAFSLMTLFSGTIYPTINLLNRDSKCRLNLITGKKKADLRVSLSNSFGFGGINSVLAFRRLPETSS